jgi:hypothetical protein
VQGRDVLPIVSAELEKVKGERDLLKMFLAKAMHVSPLLRFPSLLLRLVRWCVFIVHLWCNYFTIVVQLLEIDIFVLFFV